MLQDFTANDYRIIIGQQELEKYDLHKKNLALNNLVVEQKSVIDEQAGIIRSLENSLRNIQNNGKLEQSDNYAKL